MPRPPAAARLCLGLLLCLGCAAKQRVALDCVPHDVTVFVDGRQLDRTSESIELRSDRAHTLFFKGGAYRPQMVVLESREGESGHELQPSDLCSQTAFVPVDPTVQMVVDPEPPDDTDAPASR